MKITALAAALLLCGGSVALAQTSSTSGTTGTHGGTMATSPSSSSSMGSGTSGSSAGSTSAMSGSSHQITSDDQVKSELQAKGYTDISNIKHSGNKYTANAKQDGKSVKVQVDASSGTVTKEGG